MKAQFLSALVISALLFTGCEESSNSNPVGSNGTANGTGDLFVTSTPSGASIFLDFVSTGKITPDTVRGISAGAHSIKLVMNNFADTVVTVTVVKEQTVHCSVLLRSMSHWMAVSSGTMMDLMEIQFIDVQTGWAVGNGGTIIKTSDAGATWTMQTSGTTADLSALCFVDASTGWVAGDGGTILKTTNGGAEWIVQQSGTTNDLVAVCFATTGAGWAFGWTGTIVKTTNGGSSWSKQSAGYLLYNGHFVSSTEGWMLGYTVNQIPGSSKILKTTNSGSSWSSNSTGGSNYLFGIRFRTQTTGWVSGDGGYVKKTTNGGLNWTVQTTPTTATLMSIFPLDTLIVWSSGHLGTIIKSTDGGTTWTKQTSGIATALFSIYAINSQLCFAVGKSGMILKTTDGGG